MSATLTYERAVETMMRGLREVASTAIYDERNAWEQAIYRMANHYRTHAAYLRKNLPNHPSTEDIALTEDAAADMLTGLVSKVNMERGDRGGLLREEK